MKWIALIVSLLGLIGCASGVRSLSTPTSVPIEATATASPTRSVELTPTSAAVILATIPPVVTKPIETATPIEIAPTPTLIARPLDTVQPRPTATSTLVECLSFPTPIATRTQAAVQHFEHGLMFWLQERGEIWAMIASPLTDQFYWHKLPDLWSESQPESDPNVHPPPGRFQPVRGFGMAWRYGGGPYGPQRDDLGWAVDQEHGFDTTLFHQQIGYYDTECNWIGKSDYYELRDDHDTVYHFGGEGGNAVIIK